MQKSLKLLVTAVLSVAVLGAFAFAQDGEKAKPKHTIKEVMKGAMKGGLNKKVISGKASDKEKLELLDMYISMVENEAPRGDAASWQKFSGMAALAAAKVAVGREEGVQALKDATKCVGCHKAHKPPAKK